MVHNLYSNTTFIELPIVNYEISQRQNIPFPLPFYITITIIVIVFQILATKSNEYKTMWIPLKGIALEK